MTWMGEGSGPDNMELTESQMMRIARMANYLEDLAENLAAEPIDPKVEAHLRMAADCLREQVQLRKYYPWMCEDCTHDHSSDIGIGVKEEPNSSHFLFLGNDENKVTAEQEDIPTQEDLEKWFEEPGGNNDGVSE